MKLLLTDIVRTGNISPFKWGDSRDDILKIFPEWEKTFESHKNYCYPFFEIDSIEFYFDEDNFINLSSIIIGVWHFKEDYKSSYFDKGWLKDDLSIPKVKTILNNQNWTYEILQNPRSNEPFILSNRRTELAFDSTGYEDYNEELTALQKIYIRNKPIDSKY